METANSQGAKTHTQHKYAHLLRIPYGDDSLQFGDLYLPDGPGPHPIVILIHGGFWRNMYGLDLMIGLAESLKQHGVAAWNIEYRRVGDVGGGWPGTLLDVAQAADHLLSLATLYNLDLTRVIPIGHSAGGHLALWLAARSRLPHTSPLTTTVPSLQPTAVISLAGANDLHHVWQEQLGKGATAELLGGPPTKYPERYTEASPAALLPLGVPQVLIHGTADDRVPIIISQHYAHKASQHGDLVHLVELPDVDHFAVIDAHSHAWTTTLGELQKLWSEIL